MHVDRDTLYSLSQLAQGLGMSVRTLQRLIGDGVIPVRRLGKAVFVLGGDLLDSLPKSQGEQAEVKPKRKGSAKREG